MASHNNKIACVIFLAMLLLIAPHTSQAVNCGEVVKLLLPCLNYLMNSVGPTATCCDGAKKLYNEVTSVPDKRTTCACMKQAAKSFGINYAYANALPPKCNIKEQYKLSPDLDCNTIE